ncbi:MAG: choice-of-anchor L domain-containing protein, partial [Sulfurimonadaceae bacterium]
MKKIISPSLLWAGLICAGSSFALTTNSSVTPEQLANTILGEGVTISNVNYSGADVAAGIFNDGNNSIGFESGIVLSSGNIANVIGPNNNDGISAVNSTPGDPDLNVLLPAYSTKDATVLEFDFVVEAVPDSIQGTTTVTFQYVFTSDEYNEFVNTSYNDVFGFFVNGNNVALIPGTTIPVAINSVNSGNPYSPGSTSTSVYYRNNDLSDGGGSVDTQMDGLTTILNTQFDVVPGKVNHIKLAIADAGDAYLDSNVFIKASSFTAGLIDTDQDGIFDIEDNCPLDSNPDQEDLDNDGFGNVCDNDLSISLNKITGGGAVMSAPVG